MSWKMDRDLDEVLQDPELRRLANLLSAASRPEPPLDEAFRSALRRELMSKAWAVTERRYSWWRRLIAPPGMAWTRAAAALVVVALAVVYLTTQQSNSGVVAVTSPQSGGNAVQLAQPILVSFNQPMDHKSTEAAVQITPATAVSFSWSSNTLYVQPTSGNLAPNTQYQVTIGPGARTAAGRPVSAASTITFVTQPTVTPPPSPTTVVSPNPQLPGQQQLAPITQGAYYTPQWSADSSTLYLVGAGGALEAVHASGGAISTLVPDGVSLPAISPTGDRLAYVRGGKIEILTLSSNATVELAVTSAPTALGWANGRFIWGTGDGVYEQRGQGGPGGARRIASLANPTASGVISIAPDGRHVVYADAAQGLMLLDVSAGSATRLGPAATSTVSTAFQGWSPDGSRVMYGGVIADLTGRTVATLPSGDPSWSAQNEILVGSDAGLFEVRSDGSAAIKLADGSYHLPVWAPNSTAFAFVRGQSLWAASIAATTAPQPNYLDKAITVVTAFMQARLDGDSTRASSYLDDAGKAAYGAGGPALIPGRDRGFRRFYIVVIEPDASAPNTVRAVVRLVFGNGAIDRNLVDETLTLQRAQDTDPFLIHAVSGGTQRELGNGPQVVAVKVTGTQVQVSFDSDLIPTTAAGVSLQDSQGAPVAGVVTYSDRTVTISGLQLAVGAHYRLVVLPSVLDVSNRHLSSEYDLDLVGPSADITSGIALPTSAPAQTLLPISAS